MQAAAAAWDENFSTFTKSLAPPLDQDVQLLYARDGESLGESTFSCCNISGVAHLIMSWTT